MRTAIEIADIRILMKKLHGIKIWIGINLLIEIK